MERNNKTTFVDMERFLFIHGSSVGQSAFIPDDAPTAICNDIAQKYFSGRGARQKESDAKQALFVDIYKNAGGECYCVYSFVNNNCYGSNGRDGQYFAISILCKGVYVYPEIVYEMLHSAYSQMVNAGKIISGNEGSERYVIDQFREQSEYLSAFLKKIGSVFDGIANGIDSVIDSNACLADYDSWRGVKAGLDVCNSMACYRSLCQVGRLYVSGEYEQQSEKIKTLEAQIQSLKTGRLEMESRSREADRLSNAKRCSEIDELHSQIRMKDAEINSLRSETDGYKATIETVRSELEKYAKIGKKISNVQEKEPQYQSKDKKDLLKICLLFLVLFFTILSCILNYCFFRNIPTSLEKGKEVVVQPQDTTSSGQGGGAADQGEVTSLVATPNTVELGNNADSKVIKITTDGKWSVPRSSASWIRFQKIDESTLSIQVESNESSVSRDYTFTINAGSYEEQISVIQKGKPSVSVTYQITVTKNGKPLKANDTVLPGDHLVATVGNPNMATGFGWKYANCTGNDQGKNQKDVNVTVAAGNPGETVIIAYGPLNNQNARTKFRLKIGSTSANGSAQGVDSLGKGI